MLKAELDSTKTYEELKDESYKTVRESFKELTKKVAEVHQEYWPFLKDIVNEQDTS